MNNTVVLSCHNLSKSYREADKELIVFHQLSLEVKAGELIAIMGASGAGKSTLLHLLGGLDQATEGEIFIAGKALSALKENELDELHNRELGFIYQFHHLLPEFNAWENVAMPLWIRGTSRDEARQRALALLERVNMKEREEHRVMDLSGGERQRVAIARALIAQPRCVLADEPTGNLDEASAEQVFELMCQLNRELGTSFVIVTHNARLAERMNRVLVLEKGGLRAAKASSL